MKYVRTLFAFIGLALLASSCVSSRNVRYLQDMQDKGEVALNSKFEAVISSSDELRILVMSDGVDTEEALKPFNAYNGDNMGTMNMNQGMGYLVDVNGNIEFPSLGQVHVAGLTRLQLIDTIRTKLVEGRFLNSPIVDVRFMNFKIYFLGSNGGKSVTISNERCTFLEALALSGDLDLYTKRSRVGVMREVDGKMVVRYLDPRSSEIFNDPFFLLQQNDIILTESMNYVYFKEWMSNLGVLLTPLTAAASVAAILVAMRTAIDGLGR